MAAAAGVAAAVALVLVLVRPWEPAASPPGGIEADPARVAELEAVEAERAAENLTAAGDVAMSAMERLLPVMDGLHRALPADDELSAEDEPPADDSPSPAEPAEPAELAEWREVVAEVSAEVEALPSGSSEHNILRNGLVLSTQLLENTLDVLELAGGTGTAGDSEDSERLRGIAGDLRGRAVDAWAVAAVQLDLQYVGAERGHLHAFLPLHSGMSSEGEPGLPHGASEEPSEGHPEGHPEERSEEQPEENGTAHD